jgi:citrate synthase
MTNAIAPRGLKGLAIAETLLGDVRGTEGFYHYRQYSAVELAEHRSFEDVTRLFLDGALPDAREAASFRAELAALRALGPALTTLLPAIAAAGGSSLAGLRTALSHLAAVEELTPIVDTDADATRGELLRVIAVTPTIVAALHRLAAGLPAIEPDPSLGVAADYLRMITGTVPDARRARALEQYLVLGIDHGFNASTFTARVITSTGADPGGAIVGALGSLSGPRHGGAPSRALDTLDAIGEPSKAAAWVRAAVGAGDRIPGFGHPVYKTADPRSVRLRAVAQDLAAHGSPDDQRLVDFAVEVEGLVEATLAELKPNATLHTNVEYYAGVVMELCGLPRSLFTPTFGVARVVGWSAQILEQAADPQIIRPSANYVGPAAPAPLPIR